MKKYLAAIVVVLFLASGAWAAASFVLTNTGRSAAATGFVGASPGGLNSGTIEIQDSSNAVLVTFTLKNPVGTVSNGVLTFTNPDAATATGTGTADHAVIKNGAGTAFGTANVGTASTSIIISSTTITTNDNVSVSGSITLTVPAGT